MKILYNANIHTLDGKQPLVSAAALDGERILAVGSDDVVLGEFKGKGEAINLEGFTIIPGLMDAHIHLEQYALGLSKIDAGTETRQECLERVAMEARAAAPGEWLLGHGWNQNIWPEGYGYADDLDKAAPENPVFMTAKSLHAAWVNSSALRLAGISPDTEDPPGGRISRDTKGTPDGLLFEGAIALVENVIPLTSGDDTVAALCAALPVLWEMGLTGAHDFDRSSCFQALQVLNQRKLLKFRVLKSVPVEDLPHAVTLGLRSGFGDDYLRIGQVKIFADGALGPRTAAMLQPYKNEPDNRGMLLVDSEELFEYGRLAMENGFGLAVHAIGDRANHEVLKGFGMLRDYKAPQEHVGININAEYIRHRIEHVQVLHPDDVKSLADLGIIASMQPIHATSDMHMVDSCLGERAEFAYAWQSQFESGAVLAFGSDAPVETPDPFVGLHAAVSRRRADGSPSPQGWHPEQRLPFGEALKAYTSGAAYAANQEDRLGKLIPGYLADLIVLDTDPFLCEPEQLLEIKVLRTMVGGEWVFMR